MHSAHWGYGIAFHFDGDMQGILYVRGPDAHCYQSLDDENLLLANAEGSPLPAGQKPRLVEIVTDFDTLYRLAVEPGGGEIVVEGPDSEFHDRHSREAKAWLQGARHGIQAAAVRLSRAALRGIVFDSYLLRLQETLNDATDSLDTSPDLINSLADMLDLAQHQNEKAKQDAP